MSGMWSRFQSLLRREGRLGRPNPAPRRVRLEVEPLEGRLTPAAFFYRSVLGNLGIALDTGENLTIAEAGGLRAFTLSDGRWFNAGGDLPTANTGDTITFDATRNLSGTLAIAGGPRENNVTFSGGTINANRVIVDLTTGSNSEGDVAFTTATTAFTGLFGLDFHARGTILQTAPVTMAAPVVFTTDANLINLSNPLNDFKGPVSVFNQGSVGAALSDANDLTVSAVNTDTGALVIQAAGQVSFTGPWTVRLNKGGPSSSVSVGTGATGVNLNGATLTGTAVGFGLNDQVFVLNNQSAAPVTGAFTNGDSVTLGNTGFQIGVNVGNGNNDLALTAAGTANEIYVSNLYTVLLERPVDPGGLASWSQQLDRGVPRQQVVAGIMGSVEYLTLQVTKAYQTLLNRAPDPSGLNGWVDSLQHGATIRDVKVSFLGSLEYFQGRGGGTNTGWLNAVYNDLLGRQPDPSGQQNFGQQLDQGVPRTTVATSIYLSPEATTRLTETFYLQYLGRPADPAGLQSNASALTAGVPEESVISGLVTSPEFFNRGLIAGT
jgi:Domain of unknown function (DUF4214)